MVPKERFVSSRITGRKVLGSANPLAKGFRNTKKGCADSVSGVFLGFILFALAFWPAWCSVRGVPEVSREVEELPLMAVEDASGENGMIRIYGEPRDVDYIELDIECRDMDETVDVFWYHFVLKEYREHEEKREGRERTTEGGQEVEYATEDTVMVEEWEMVEETTEIADSFMLGNIEIETRRAQHRLVDFETCEDKGKEQLGEEWLLIEYMPLDEIDELVVVGDLRNNEISAGEPFIITDQDPDELVSTMAAEEKGTRTAAMILSIVLFFFAFNLIIGPLLFLLNYVPVIGGGLRFGIGIASLILAVVLVLVIRLIIGYWWVILIIAAVIIAWLIMKARKQPEELEEEPVSVEEKPAPAEGKPVEVEGEPVPVKEKPVPVEEKPATPGQVEPPAHPMLRCPECGDPYNPGDKYCDNCGHKLVD